MIIRLQGLQGFKLLSEFDSDLAPRSMVPSPHDQQATTEYRPTRKQRANAAVGRRREQVRGRASAPYALCSTTDNYKTWIDECNIRKERHATTAPCLGRAIERVTIRESEADRIILGRSPEQISFLESL